MCRTQANLTELVAGDGERSTAQSRASSCRRAGAVWRDSTHAVRCVYRGGSRTHILPPHYARRSEHSLVRPRSWVNFAGNCTNIRWEVDEPSPDLADGLQTITHHACIADDYVPSFEFFGFEDWLYHDAVRIEIVSQSVEIAILLIAAALLLMLAIRRGTLPYTAPILLIAALLLIPVIRVGVLPRSGPNRLSIRRLGALVCIVLALVMFNYVYTAAKRSLLVNPTDQSAPFFVSFQPTLNTLPNGCLDLVWQADDAQTVFLNDALVGARGDQQYCATGTQLALSLKINTANNQSYVYSLTAPIFDTEEVRLTIAAALLLLFLAGALLHIPGIRHPGKFSVSLHLLLAY